MYRKCFVIIIFIPIIHAFTCGQSNIKGNVESNTKIINGTEARPDSWPWIVTLQHPILGHFCGGSLIDANYVISAAHCFFSVYFDDSIIHIGNHYLNDKIQQRTIQKVIRHPSYVLVDGNPNDIVLLKLNESIDLMDYPPICLPTSNTVILELPGQNVIVAGWGLTNEGVSSDVLLQTTLKIHDSSIPACQPFVNDTNKQLCVGVIGGGTGTCSGDSGGPLMAEYNDHYYLVGIVSAGIAGCGNTSTLYIRVRAFIDWICEADSNITYCSLMNNITSPSPLTSSVTSMSMTPISITPPTTNKNEDGNKQTIIIVATVVPSVIVIIGILITLFCFLKK